MVGAAWLSALQGLPPYAWPRVWRLAWLLGLAVLVVALGWWVGVQPAGCVCCPSLPAAVSAMWAARGAAAASCGRSHSAGMCCGGGDLTAVQPLTILHSSTKVRFMSRCFVLCRSRLCQSKLSRSGLCRSVPCREQVTGRGQLYTGVADCLAKTVRAEGLRGLYKGWLPNWLRIG